MAANPYDPRYTAASSSLAVGSYYNPYTATSNTLSFVSAPPTTCSGLVHVFECRHEKACKCGKVQRRVQCDVCAAAGPKAGCSDC